MITQVAYYLDEGKGCHGGTAVSGATKMFLHTKLNKLSLLNFSDLCHASVFAFQLSLRRQLRDEIGASPMPIEIVRERPDTPSAIQLIEELESILSSLYPTESRHGYSVEKLIQQQVAFFVIRDGENLVGCGGVQLYGTDFAELKRMYVRPDYRGRGFAKQMLDHLAAHSQENGVHVLRLETGVYQDAAIKLYERYGFKRIPPFGDYVAGKDNLFYEKTLA